jgi:hypothetical protein
MKKALKPEVKLGAEPKKIAALGALLAIAGIVYWINSSDSPSPSRTSSARPAAIDPSVPVDRVRTPPRSAVRAFSQQSRGASLQEFKPTLKPKDPIDPSRIDPTLKLNLLSRLRSVNLEGGSRSLFDFASAPAPVKTELPKVKPIIPGDTRVAGFIGPVQEKPKPPAPPPPPTPIPLKFYGFTNPLHAGAKKAFFLEGEDIFVAAEGDMIKNRYKVVRIGVNSAVVEDTSDKHQQTLPLVAEEVAS